MCGKDFPSEKILQGHFEGHDLPKLSDDLESQCFICHRIFDTEALVEIHIVNEHCQKQEKDKETDERVIKLLLIILINVVFITYTFLLIYLCQLCTNVFISVLLNTIVTILCMVRE